VKLFLNEEELENLFLVESCAENLLLLLLEPKLLGLLNLLGLVGAGVVVVVVFLKLNLDLVLECCVLVLGLLVGVEVDATDLLFNLALDLDLVRSGVLLVGGSGTSGVACLLKPTLCLEDDWTGLLTELLES